MSIKLVTQHLIINKILKRGLSFYGDMYKGATNSLNNKNPLCLYKPGARGLFIVSNRLLYSGKRYFDFVRTFYRRRIESRVEGLDLFFLHRYYLPFKYFDLTIMHRLDITSDILLRLINFNKYLHIWEPRIHAQKRIIGNHILQEEKQGVFRYNNPLLKGKSSDTGGCLASVSGWWGHLNWSSKPFGISAHNNQNYPKKSSFRTGEKNSLAVNILKEAGPLRVIKKGVLLNNFFTYSYINSYIKKIKEAMPQRPGLVSGRIRGSDYKDKSSTQRASYLEKRAYINPIPMVSSYTFYPFNKEGLQMSSRLAGRGRLSLWYGGTSAGMDLYGGMKGGIPYSRGLTIRQAPLLPYRSMTLNRPFIKVYSDREGISHNKIGQNPPVLTLKKPSTYQKRIDTEEIQRTVSEKIYKYMDKVIEEKIYKNIRLNPEYSKKITESVYSQINDRIVFEKERLGRF